ncbi:hypothetical protein D3C72_1254900 [compost metagenome]
MEIGFAQGKGQRNDHQHQQCAHHQRIVPAQAGDQLAFDRHHEKLAKRACGSSNAHGPGAPLWRYLPADHAVDHRVRGAGLRHADQKTCCQRKQHGIGSPGHACQAQRIQQGPGHQHLGGAKAVGQHAGEDADQAPAEVLHGQRKGEGFARPAHLLRDGLQPQAKTVTNTHRQGDHGTAAQKDAGDGQMLCVVVLHMLRLSRNNRIVTATQQTSCHPYIDRPCFRPIWGSRTVLRALEPIVNNFYLFIHTAIYNGSR